MTAAPPILGESEGRRFESDLGLHFCHLEWCRSLG
jgi:hypothetical protein